MREAMLCIQCRDRKSGKVGTFLAECVKDSFPTQKGARNRAFNAISPVFSDYISLSFWCSIYGWELQVFSAEYPTGLYVKKEN